MKTNKKNLNTKQKEKTSNKELGKFYSQEKIDEMSKEFFNIDFVDWYEKGLIDEEECDFYVAIYKKIVSNIIKDSKI